MDITICKSLLYLNNHLLELLYIAFTFTKYSMIKTWMQINASTLYEFVHSMHRGEHFFNHYAILSELAASLVWSSQYIHFKDSPVVYSKLSFNKIRPEKKNLKKS